jgi:hypothetical protein
MFSEPNRGFLGFRTEPNSEPNRPTFVKNRSKPSEIKKSIPHTPTEYDCMAGKLIGLEDWRLSSRVKRA